MNCPHCSSDANNMLYTFISADAARHICREDDPRFQAIREITENLWSRKSCNMLECATCGLVLSDLFIAGNDQFYNLVYNDHAEYRELKWEFSQSIDLLQKLQRVNICLL